MAGEDPDSIIERVLVLACYLIENGPVIKAGQTFGTSLTERIKTRPLREDGVDYREIGFDRNADGKPSLTTKNPIKILYGLLPRKRRRSA